MNQALELYKVNKEIFDIIESSVDENGEISVEAIEQLDKLQVKKEDLIHSVGLTAIINGAESEKVMNEIRRLQAIKKHYDSRQSAAERLLRKSVKIGEEYSFDNLKIKWKKNPPKVETDPDLDLNDLQANFPELVKVEYSVDKNLIKEYHKNNKPLPEKVRVVQDLSLQIK